MKLKAISLLLFLSTSLACAATLIVDPNGSADYTTLQPTISGYVLDGSGAGIEAVNITADSNGGTASTDANGYYSLTVPYEWSGKLVPSKEVMAFEPNERSFTDVIESISGQDFNETFRIFTRSWEIINQYDDAYSTRWPYGDETTDVSSSTLKVGYDRLYETDMTCGLRFQAFDVTKQAVILDAYLTLIRAASVPTYEYISTRGERNANAPQFSSNGPSLWSRARTYKSQVWGWTAGAPETPQFITELEDIVEEVTSLPDWSPGNPIVFLLDPYFTDDFSAPYVFYAYGTSKHASLTVTYQYAPSISGNVFTSQGQPLAEVQIIADNGGETVLTDQNGYYELRVPPGWSGTVLPYKNSYAFNLPERSYQNLYSDKTEQNYIASLTFALNETSFDFIAYGKTDTAVPSQNLILSNPSQDAIDWQIRTPNDCNWLSVTPQSGQVTDVNSITTLSIEPNKAPEYGYNYCTLQVIDTNIPNSPRSIEVRLRVYGPGMTIAPSWFNIYAEKNKTAERTFSITNSGFDILNWTIEVPNDCNWISSVNPFSGYCGHYESVEVTVTVDSNGLELNELYQTQLIISSPQVSSKYCNIQLTIYEPNEIHVPYDYPTLQQAVDAAQVYGDTIIVHPGKYAGCDTKGKSLTITSIDPNNPSIVAATIIGSAINGIIYEDATGFLELKGLSIIHDPEIQTDSYTDIVSYYANTYIKNCTVKNWPEGGVNIWGFWDIGKVMIENCLISGNKVAGILTRFRARNLNINVNNCTITNTLPDIQGNVSGIRMDGYDNIELNINNSILSNCKSPNDVEIAFNSIYSREMNYLSISNSCLPSGPNGIFIADQNYVNVSYGIGNIETDPCFAREGYLNDNNTPADSNDDYWIEGDYHLKSQYGRWQWSSFVKMDADGDGFLDMTDFAVLAGEWGKTTTTQIVNGRSYYPYLRADLDDSGTVDINDLMIFCDNYLYHYDYGWWVYDDVTSPCIDAGDPNDPDWQNELWPHGKRINMGAYGGTAEASMSPAALGNPADFDNDDDVDINDLSLLTDVWPITEIMLKQDLDRNGFVDFFDFAIFANNWLWTETP